MNRTAYKVEIHVTLEAQLGTDVATQEKHTQFFQEGQGMHCSSALIIIGVDSCQPIVLATESKNENYQGVFPLIMYAVLSMQTVLKEITLHS